MVSGNEPPGNRLESGVGRRSFRIPPGSGVGEIGGDSQGCRESKNSGTRLGASRHGAFLRCHRFRARWAFDGLGGILLRRGFRSLAFSRTSARRCSGGVGCNVPEAPSGRRRDGVDACDVVLGVRLIFEAPLSGGREAFAPRFAPRAGVRSAFRDFRRGGSRLSTFRRTKRP